MGWGKTYHSLRITVPWANHEAVPDTPQPKLPFVMEAYCRSPYPSHTVYVNGDNGHGGCVEHCLSAEIPPALNMHKYVNTDSLRSEDDHI